MIEQQNWKQLSSIQVGSAICLPVIMIGQTLSQNYGFAAAIIAILLGNAILLLFGCISAWMSCQTKKTTAQNAVDYFGQKGVTLFAMVMLASMLGWFGIQLNVISLSVIDFLALQPSNRLIVIATNVVLGLLLVVIARYGIRSLRILSKISMPLLISTLLYALVMVDTSKEVPSQPITFSGISIVIAIAITVVIDLPTYFRHAKSNRDGIISVFVIFGLAMPLIELVGVYISMYGSGGNILENIKGQNSPFWNLWVALFLALAGGIANVTNLYSGTASLEFLAPRISEKWRTCLIGIAGIFLGCLDLLRHMEFILDVLGVVIGSMGAVISVRYFISLLTKKPVMPSNRYIHLGAWTAGTIAGLCSIGGYYFLTNIPVLDACLTAMMVTTIILIERGTYEISYSR